jgi:hypothetical protein
LNRLRNNDDAWALVRFNKPPEVSWHRFPIARNDDSPVAAASASTSGSDNPRVPPSEASRKSIAGSRRRAALITFSLKSASAMNFGLATGPRITGRQASGNENFPEQYH